MNRNFAALGVFVSLSAGFAQQAGGLIPRAKGKEKSMTTLVQRTSRWPGLLTRPKRATS